MYIYTKKNNALVLSRRFDKMFDGIGCFPFKTLARFVVAAALCKFYFFAISPFQTGIALQVSKPAIVCIKKPGLIFCRW